MLGTNSRFMDDGWAHPLAKTLPSLVNHLWLTIVMDDWNMDEKSRNKCFNTINLESSNKIYKEWQTMLS